MYFGDYWFVYLGILALVLLLDYWIAKWFLEAAEMKGHHDQKYFHICFWLGAIGYLLVVALPDRGNQKNEIATDELPEL